MMTTVTGSKVLAALTAAVTTKLEKETFHYSPVFIRGAPGILVYSPTRNPPQAQSQSLSREKETNQPTTKLTNQNSWSKQRKRHNR